MSKRRRAAAAAIGTLTLTLTAEPAAAHGFGGRSDLPLPAWMFLYGAGGALLVSFAALAAFWPRPRLEGGVPGKVLLSAPGSEQGARTRLRGLALVVARILGLAVLAALVVAAFAGENNLDDNLTPVFVYVVFWVGMQLVCALVGDVWPALSPFDTMAAVGQRFRESRAQPSDGDEGQEEGWGYWPAAVLMFAFVWLELVYPEANRSEPRHLGVAIVVYTIAVLAAAARWGRGWLRTGEAFGAWFGVLGHMAPLYRDEERRLRLRPPFVGLASLRPVRGMEALVLVVLGSTTFDGLSRTQFWTDLVESQEGWGRVPFDTAGLVWAVGMVTVIYVAAMRVTARQFDRQPGELATAFVHSLVPIALAYAVAHYFSLFVFEGQKALRLASDPLGEGWNLFGTADWKVNLNAVSTGTIAYVQAGAIVAGHVAGVILAHDRALALFPGRAATRSQYPLLVAMVVFTVGGLALLLGT